MSTFTARLTRAVAVGLLSMLAALGLTLAASTPANAQAYTSDGAPAVSDTSPAPGESIVVAGDGFRSGSTVRVVIFSEPVVLGTASADAAGEVSLDVRIPSSFESGSTHRIELQGVDPSGEMRVLSRNVTLAGGSAGALARTGAAAIPLMALAGGLLIVGGALVATGRFGRKTQTD